MKSIDRMAGEGFIQRITTPPQRLLLHKILSVIAKSTMAETAVAFLGESNAALRTTHQVSLEISWRAFD
jgi:hypothetical protein